MAHESKDTSFGDIKRIGKLSREGVFIYNATENRFTYLNSAMVRILEINKNVLMDDPGLLLRSIPDEDLDYIRIQHTELWEKESLQDVQIRFVQNKVEKVFSCNCFVCGDGSSIVGFVRDITRPKEHEEFLINYGARKDTILDMVSQNLSTPLNLSKFTLDLIEKAVKEKKYHRLDGHLNLMREITSESIRIIDDFLQEEHLESPKIQPKASRFDAMSKIMIILERLKESHPDKQFRVKAAEKHLFMNADAMKFFQIVHNILSNSVKFTRKNAVIETTVQSHKGKVMIVIKDNGIGIPDNLQPFIFERKSRASRPGLKGEVSNGIGLYVVKKLTTMLRGRVSFESKEGKGTTFTLEFPSQ